MYKDFVKKKEEHVSRKGIGVFGDEMMENKQKNL